MQEQYKAVFRKAIPPSRFIVLPNNSPTGGYISIVNIILEQLYPFQEEKQNNSSSSDDLPFTEQELSAVIRLLPRGKAPGYDSIGNIVIQEIHKKYPQLLVTLFNKFMAIGKYPDPFKIVDVILFQKPGKDIKEISEYRPIALLSTIAKVLEKLMKQSLVRHLETYNKLSPLQ
ncbi:hypothetical protein AVEN_185936-1 [Araneus ventricosus]|uniref:Reverse transcriptase domain-containing protein n=1 Tax=Araneus ventricosus TaxID=182803 RepID=A0A4Y2JD66_ARAVE|nr:hypothetical protein AVEN_185936-1 [Araneus ventricosus]